MLDLFINIGEKMKPFLPSITLVFPIDENIVKEDDLNLFSCTLYGRNTRLYDTLYHSSSCRNIMYVTTPNTDFMLF